MLMCMCMLNKRVHVLFDNQLWTMLLNLAEAKKTSVAKLVRDAVKTAYVKDAELEERRKVIEEIERIRPHLKSKLDYKAMINYGRK